MRSEFNYVPDLNDSRSNFNGEFGQRDRGETDRRMDLYQQYAVPHESYEDFVDRMADDFGPRWVNKF